MSNTEIRNKNSQQITARKIKVTGNAQTAATTNRSAVKAKRAYNWAIIGALTLVVLTLIGLQSLGLIWLSQDRAHSQRVAAHVTRLQTQIIDLRSLMETNLAEEMIYLKILVLNSRISNPTAREIASAIYKFARRYDKDPDLILSIMKVESAFDPTIVSSMGAIGLMQIMPQWIDVLDIRCDLNNPDCNVRYGLQILGAYEQLYGKLEMALTAYNRGPGPVDYALMRGKDPDNGYAGKVQAVYNRLRAINRSKQELEVAYSKQ